MTDMANLMTCLYETALSAGLPVISGDKCCRLLAWLYVYGGGNEQVIEGKLNAAIIYAQKRLNILGGETPDAELMPVLTEYVRSIADFKNPPEWVDRLEKEYGLKPRRGW